MADNKRKYYSNRNRQVFQKKKKNLSREFGRAGQDILITKPADVNQIT